MYERQLQQAILDSKMEAEQQNEVSLVPEFPEQQVYFILLFFGHG